MWNNISKTSIFIGLLALVGLLLIVYFVGGSGVEIVTVFALVTGPMIAVVIAKYMENHRAKRERRMDIFRTLMRTRVGTQRLYPDHVYALNLVEVEFYDDPKVYAAWKDYIESLNQQSPQQQDLQRLLANLLREMSLALNYKFEGLAIFAGGYAPNRWLEGEIAAEEWQYIRRYLIALAKQETELSIAVKKMPTDVQSGNHNPFQLPPPNLR